MNDLTDDQMNAIETEAEIAEVLRLEEEMQEARVFIPWIGEDGEETDMKDLLDKDRGEMV